MKKYLLIGLVSFLVAYTQHSFAGNGTVSLAFTNGKNLSFDAIVCRTDQHQNGNLTINASVSAQGKINDEKVVLFIDQSHPVGTPNQLFEDLQIWVTDISTDELTTYNKNYLSRNLDADLNAWYQEQQIAIQKKYLVTNEMTPEQMIESSNKTSEELDDVHNVLLKKQTKMLRAFGTSQIDGHTIRFDSGPVGLEMFTRGEPVNFADVLGVKFSATVSCSQ